MNFDIEVWIFAFRKFWRKKKAKKMCSFVVFLRRFIFIRRETVYHSRAPFFLQRRSFFFHFCRKRHLCRCNPMGFDFFSTFFLVLLCALTAFNKSIVRCGAMSERMNNLSNWNTHTHQHRIGQLGIHDFLSRRESIVLISFAYFRMTYCVYFSE